MNTKNDKVQILLSTYNGEKYLTEQISSLLKQNYPNISILIRDDGSCDNTIGILNELKTNEKIDAYLGENVGVVSSFFELLTKSDPEADYIAFCDQDDIWLEDKVTRAVEVLSQKDFRKPLMYCSKLTVVDENLNILKKPSALKYRPAFENSLVENIATGCTIVMNNAARDILLRELPIKVNMHDWWIYQVISAIGEVVIDDQSNLLYRQHSSNVVGIKTNFFSKWKKRLVRFMKNKDRRTLRNQAQELSRIFGEDLSLSKKKVLRSFIEGSPNFISRVKYAMNTELFRQDKIDNIIFKILIVFDLI